MNDNEKIIISILTFYIFFAVTLLDKGVVRSVSKFILSIFRSVSKFMTFQRRFALFEIIVFISFLIIFYEMDIIKTYYVIPFLMILLFFMVTSYIFVDQRIAKMPFFTNINTTATNLPTFTTFLLKMISFIGIIVASITFIIFLVRSINKSPSLQDGIFYILNFLIMIGAFYLIFHIFFKGNAASEGNSSSERIDTKNTFIRKIIKLMNLQKIVAYISRLFIKLSNYLKQILKLPKETKTVWIILALEATIIALRFLLPYLIRFITGHDARRLLTEPKYLDNENKLSSFEQLYGDITDEDPEHRYRYSLSAWFTINPQPPNTRAAYKKYTTILNFGNKPHVQFNSKENTLRVQVQIKDNGGNVILKDIYTEKNVVPFQKWNHIVINYDGGNMDVFLNGVLVASKPNVAPYMQYDEVISGENQGIEGGICNVAYYNRILTQGEISLEYKLLRNTTPPIL